MKKDTLEKVKVLLIGFIEGMVGEYKKPKVQKQTFEEFFSPEKGRYMPFHRALLPKGLLLSRSFFRSFSTKLGQRIFERVAHIVASDSGLWEKVERNCEVKVGISDKSLQEIEEFLDKLSHRPSNVKPEDVPNIEAGATIRDLIADLFLVDSNGTEYFLEIKSPKPNKDQTRRTKEKLLTFLARGGRYYFALPYNPWGDDPSTYKWSFTWQFFSKREVLIGRDFWDFIGGPGTYARLLEVFEEVGKEAKEVIYELLMED